MKKINIQNQRKEQPDTGGKVVIAKNLKRVREVIDRSGNVIKRVEY